MAASINTRGEGGSSARVTRRELLAGLGGLAAGVALGGRGEGLLRSSAALAAPAHPRADDYDAAVPTAWFDLLRALVQHTAGFSPPVAARALAYAGVTLYETVVPGLPDHRTLAGQLDGLAALPRQRGPACHWAAAANAALAAVARGLWPTADASQRAAVEALEGSFAATFGREAPRGVLQRSVHWGRDLAGAVLEWASGDGGHEGYARNFPDDYTPPSGDGLWVPTPPGFQPALQPYWGGNRPFVPAGDVPCSSAVPTPFSADTGSRFYAEAVEVYEAVNTLTDEQEQVALFWADDPGATATPPGHSFAIATQVVREQAADLATAAETFAKVGMAAADAFVACWRTKYATNLLRPVTYIQAHLDGAWGGSGIPLPVGTPPFPEYPSGHSVQSAATAEVLTDLFGDDYAFTDHTHDGRGMVPRRFPSFAAAAEEAAVSRLYGGIHYRPAIEDGLADGRCCGQAVNALQMRA